jgi:putative transposase
VREIIAGRIIAAKFGERDRARLLAAALDKPNSPAKPPALPERIEAVLPLREWNHEIIGSPWGNREVLKEIAMSQGHNHLNHATWECKYHVVFTPKYREKALFGQIRLHLGTVFRELARRKECQIEEGHPLPDHVHMLILILPKYSVAEMIGYLKGRARSGLRRMWNARCGIFWATNSGRGATSSRP